MTTTMAAPGSTTPSTTPAYLAFAAFGSLWGVWGAALPQVRDQAGLDDGRLGTALLFVAAGGLPAMLLTGRVADRLGRQVAAATLLLLAACGLGVALTAHGLLSLCVGLTLLGAASGAADVAINTVAVETQHARARPVVTRAHGTFSTAVVVASLLTGLLRHLEVPMAVPFALVLLVAAAAAVALRGSERPLPPPASSHVATRPTLPRRRVLVLAAVGLVAALGYAVENAHQSWGAVYLGDVLTVSPGVTAAAPALFAAVVAVTRLGVGALPPLPPLAVLLAGGTLSAAGTLLLASADTLVTGLLGMAGAAAGTAVLFPTLLTAGVADVDPAVRGRATSAITATAYLGFLLGPVLVGWLAQSQDLRAAMVGVAGLAVVLTLASWPVLRAAAAVSRSDAGQSDAGRSDVARCAPPARPHR